VLGDLQLLAAVGYAGAIMFFIFSTTLFDAMIDRGWVQLPLIFGERRRGAPPPA
jgi:hypothetical protein